MFKRRLFNSEDLAFALILWLCTLPLIALILVPVIGLSLGGLTAVALLALSLGLCWAASAGFFRGRLPRE